MTVIIQEVYNAFKDAGTSEEKAMDAAKALSGHDEKFHGLEREVDRRFNSVDKQFSELKREFDQRFNQVDLKIEKIEGRLQLYQWMMGFQMALTVAILFLLLRMAF